MVEYGVTHFVRIPYATAESTPQIANATERLARDPIAAALPREAWCTPGQYHLSIMPLSLKTPARVDKALQLLNSLKPSGAAKMGESKAKLLERSHPPSVSLYGLRKNKEFPEVGYLGCSVKEPAPFLKAFRALIIETFFGAGLIPVAPPTYRLHHDQEQKMMYMQYLRTTALKDHGQLEGKGYYRSPKFDATHLQPKYEDTQWTDDFPLEKICISEFGLRDLYSNGTLVEGVYRDIAYAPLPGVSASTISAPRSDDEYTKAARRYHSNQPVMPLVIRSTPPA
ncbi:MAG: hypothetical protein Q9169_007236 [Polycauliona sp. 2 TL-2023]